MRWLRTILFSFVAAVWLISAVAKEEDSYYFQNDQKLIQRLDEITLFEWLSSRTRGQAKFDLTNLSLSHLLDPKLRTLDLLSYENVLLINSNLKLENKLAAWIVHGDPSIDPSLQDTLRARAALVLYKLKPQKSETLRPLLKVLMESSYFRMRQILAGIFVKASPNLDFQMVDVLKDVMKNDKDSPTRSLATLAVLLNSENNEENLKSAVQVMIEDHQDIMKILQPWFVVRSFLEQSSNHLLETPTRGVSPAFKAKILSLVSNYHREGGVESNQARYAKFRLLLLQEM